jgi:hypothetical protein
VVEYHAALQQENKTPNIITQAYVQLPYIVSLHGLSSHYEHAREVLQAIETVQSFRLNFSCGTRRLR